MTGYIIYVHKNSDQTNGSIYEQFDFRKIPNKVRVWCGLCNRDPGVAVRRKSPESLICCVYLAVHYVTPRTCRDPVNSIPSDTSRSCFSPTSLFLPSDHQIHAVLFNAFVRPEIIGQLLWTELILKFQGLGFFRWV